MKLNQIFAAQRTSIQMEIQDRIQRELLPVYNSEVEDITRQFKEIWKRNQALARTKKTARVAMLSKKKWDILNPLKKDYMDRVDAVIDELEGKVEDTPVEGGGTARMVLFGDGTTANYPKGLFIPFDQFHKA